MKFISQDKTVISETFPVGPLACNCSIIGDTVSKNAIVIDPGDEGTYIMERVKALNLNIIALVCTHAHFDHCLATGILHEKTGAPIYLHKDDYFLWQMLELQCHLFKVPYQKTIKPHYWLKEDTILPCCHGVVIHTPGHSPGSVSLWFEKHLLLFAGDTLFKNTIGRTDLWGGSRQKIKKSIREKLYSLHDNALVITGHGRMTTIGEEKDAGTLDKF